MWILIGAVTLIMAGLVLIFAPRGEEAPEEASGDLIYIEGSAPKDADRSRELVDSVADITDAAVTRAADQLVFTAAVAGDIPPRFKRAGLEFRWDVTSSEPLQEWIVSASLSETLTASVLSQTSNYGSGTTDGTMPGSVTATGKTLTITLDPSEVPDFPSTFTWRMSTVLDADRRDVRSARVEDRFPNDGVEQFEG